MYKVLTRVHIPIPFDELVKNQHQQMVTLTTKKASTRFFPDEVVTHLTQHKHEYVTTTYIYILPTHHVHIEFVHNTTDTTHMECDMYAQLMLCWLRVLCMIKMKTNKTNKTNQTNEKSKLSIHVYFTPLLKTMPSTQGEVIKPTHANSGFASTSPPFEIVIFRKEEWFKVFIHETFHAFGLDFSRMHELTAENKRMADFFGLDTHLNLCVFEAYTECWARILNICITSFFVWTKTKTKTKTKTRSSSSVAISIAVRPLSTFVKLVKRAMHQEAMFGVFQMNKVLRFMNMTYLDLLQGNRTNRQRFKQRTNVFAYYVLASILMANSDTFLDWCLNHNDDWWAFRNRDHQNIAAFYDLCMSLSYSSHTLAAVESDSSCSNTCHHTHNTMRMTSCKSDLPI